MFKLGVIGDEVSQDFETVVNLATEFNLDSIEIRSVWDKPPQDLDEKDIAEMKRILELTDLTIIGVASPFFKYDFYNEKEREEHLDILKRCIKLAKAFDAKIIRGFAFWQTGKTEKIWDEILEAYQEPIRMAEEAEITFGMENEASTSLSTAKLTEKFIRELDSPNVKAIWDPANELFAEGGEKPYPDAYNRLKLLMIHGHIKDAKPDPETGEMDSVPVGDGLVNWKAHLQGYIDDGYNGHLCLETHWRPKTALSKELVDEPGGAAFSAAGEEASRVCLENLQNIIAELKK